MCLPDERRALRLEERRDEEGMAVELHGADLSGPIPSDDPEWPLLEETRIPRAESVTAVVGLLRAVRAIDPGEPGACNDEHLARDLHQLARERRDDRRGGVRLRLRVGGALDAQDVAGVLEQRVLEAAAGAEERAPVLPRVADGEQRAGLASIRARRDAPDSLAVRHRASVEPPGERLGADPF